MGADGPRISRTEIVDLLVGLLVEIDEDASESEFYDRICEALCRLTTLERAGLVLYDRTRGTAGVVGSHGVPEHILVQIEADPEEAPIAWQAVEEDRVVEVSEGLEAKIPERLVYMATVSALACAPVAAGGNWFGVILADRGGSPLGLSEEEKQTMLTMGRLAALGATVERAARQSERARNLSQRISLVREIHERVIQKLFGLSLALGADSLSEAELRRCHDQLREVLVELRAALGRPLAPTGHETTTTLRELVARMAEREPLSVRWEEGVEVPEHVEPLAQSVLTEAVRNAGKHADASRIEVEVAASPDAFRLEVRNDGTRPRQGPPGIGLRLLTLEALQHDSLVEFGPREADGWRVRLVVPGGGR